MDVEVMPEGFAPRRRGRKPTYDISDVLAGLAAHPGNWVKFKLSPEQARSARNQLSKMGFDVAIENGVNSGEPTVVYVRSQG